MRYGNVNSNCDKDKNGVMLLNDSDLSAITQALDLIEEEEAIPEEVIETAIDILEIRHGLIPDEISNMRQALFENGLHTHFYWLIDYFDFTKSRSKGRVCFRKESNKLSHFILNISKKKNGSGNGNKNKNINKNKSKTKVDKNNRNGKNSKKTNKATNKSTNRSKGQKNNCKKSGNKNKNKDKSKLKKKGQKKVKNRNKIKNKDENDTEEDEEDFDIEIDDDYKNSDKKEYDYDVFSFGRKWIAKRKDAKFENLESELRNNPYKSLKNYEYEKLMREARKTYNARKHECRKLKLSVTHIFAILNYTSRSYFTYCYKSTYRSDLYIGDGNNEKYYSKTDIQRIKDVVNNQLDAQSYFYWFDRTFKQLLSKLQVHKPHQNWYFGMYPKMNIAKTQGIFYGDTGMIFHMISTGDTYPIDLRRWSKHGHEKEFIHFNAFVRFEQVITDFGAHSYDGDDSGDGDELYDPSFDPEYLALKMDESDYNSDNDNESINEIKNNIGECEIISLKFDPSSRKNKSKSKSKSKNKNKNKNENKSKSNYNYDKSKGKSKSHFEKQNGNSDKRKSASGNSESDDDISVNSQSAGDSAVSMGSDSDNDSDSQSISDSYSCNSRSNAIRKTNKKGKGTKKGNTNEKRKRKGKEKANGNGNPKGKRKRKDKGKGKGKGKVKSNSRQSQSKSHLQSKKKAKRDYSDSDDSQRVSDYNYSSHSSDENTHYDYNSSQTNESDIYHPSESIDDNSFSDDVSQEQQSDRKKQKKRKGKTDGKGKGKGRGKGKEKDKKKDKGKRKDKRDGQSKSKHKRRH